MDVHGNERLRFGDFEFDSISGRLFQRGRPVKIQPQPLRVLAALLESAGEIVSREHLRTRIWGGSTFVEFDQGLNYCIRQIRLALRDGTSKPLYIETLPKQGYRFIADLTVLPDVPNPSGANQSSAQPRAASGSGIGATAALSESTQPEAGSPFFRLPARQVPIWRLALAFVALAILGAALYSFFRPHTAALKYTQLTDFADSALAPALSPDGRMVAFIRGSSSFLTADQIYVKVLPNGEAKRLTDDPRRKYSLAFTPDGAQIAYTVLHLPNWVTYTVSVLGGDAHLFLSNAAGLTWLDEHQLLFSRTRSGQHMGIVTGTATGQEFREVYFPVHERAMAHYSFASPDHKLALVVEMNEIGGWAPCRLFSLDGRFDARPIGPQGPCRSAGWSPDGSWMYFTAYPDGHSHVWRQRFPDGKPEQITSGPLEAEGVAVDPDGRSLITSMGVWEESAIWIHDPNGERSLSSEGEIVADISPPSFSADDSLLYYLLRHESDGSGPELWRTTVESGKSEAVFPGVSMLAYDVSPDGKQVVYCAARRDGIRQLWLAPVDRSSPPRRIGVSGETRPHFGPRGKILFQATERNFNYLEQMNPDGTGRSKVIPYPVSTIKDVSPGRRWVMAMAPVGEGPRVAPVAIPTDGGPPRLICADYCVPKWSSTGEFLVIPIEAPSRTSPGRSLAIPVGPGETLPELPPGGIDLRKAGVLPGVQSIARGELIPGKDSTHFAYVNTMVHRNLYRITLP